MGCGRLRAAAWRKVGSGACVARCRRFWCFILTVACALSVGARGALGHETSSVGSAIERLEVCEVASCVMEPEMGCG